MVSILSFRPLCQQTCRQQLALDDSAPIILSVGDRLKEKGFHLLLRAFAAVLERHPRAMLAIVGGPGRHGRDYSTALMQECRQLRITAHVRFVGAAPQHQLPLWYNAADLFVLLSAREGSSNVVLESLACGTPVVSTDVGESRNLARQVPGGFRVVERDSQRAAETIMDIVRDVPSRSKTAAAMQNGGWSRTADQVHSVFARVLEQKPRTHVGNTPSSLSLSRINS